MVNSVSIYEVGEFCVYTESKQKGTTDDHDIGFFEPSVRIL